MVKRKQTIWEKDVWHKGNVAFYAENRMPTEEFMEELKRYGSQKYNYIYLGVDEHGYIWVRPEEV